MTRGCDFSAVPSPFPACVKKIGIAAPAKRADPEWHGRTLAMFHAWGVEAVCAPHLTEEGDETYFGSDAQKRAEGFNALLREPGLDLILCTRGGYGSGYLLDLIDWPLLAEKN